MRPALSVLMKMFVESTFSSPRQMELVPPGAWCSRVEDLAVRTLPAFWLRPSAKAFDEKGRRVSPRTAGPEAPSCKTAPTLQPLIRFPKSLASQCAFSRVLFRTPGSSGLIPTPRDGVFCNTVRDRRAECRVAHGLREQQRQAHAMNSTSDKEAITRATLPQEGTAFKPTKSDNNLALKNKD